MGKERGKISMDGIMAIVVESFEKYLDANNYTKKERIIFWKSIVEKWNKPFAENLENMNRKKEPFEG